TMKVPATIINGSRPGKTVAITGGIHGGEYPAIETAIRLAQSLSPEQILGNMAIVHIANVSSFEAKMQYYSPEDGKNLNRMFPGKYSGTIMERIAYTITTELHDRADFYIDLHGGDIHEDLIPFVICPSGASEEVVRLSREAAEKMGIELVVGSVSTTGAFVSAAARGVPSFLAEIGGCGVWTEDEVKAYIDGIKNVLKHLGVLDGEVEDLGKATYLPKTHGVSAMITGCWYPSIKPGEIVVKDQKAGEIRDYFGNLFEEYFAPASGIVLYVISSLAVTKDEALFAIA
ncbi:MAG: M14 family metallopeptidase, partial [bacterium]|nr:M14 family metallopeptidase [bacterium]